MADFVMPTNTRAPVRSAEKNDPVVVDADVVVLGTVDVRRGPIGHIATDGTTLVVTNYGDNSVSVIDADTLTVESTVTVAGEPFTAAATDDRAYVSATSASYDSVSVVDTDTKAVIAFHPLAFSVTAVAVSPDGKRVFAGRSGRDHVDIAVIDITSDRVGTIDLAGGAGINVDAIRVSPSGKRVYAATTDVRGSRLMVVDAETARVIGTVMIGPPIRDLALSPDGRIAYILSCDPVHGGVVDVIDLTTHAITGTAAIGGFPMQMTLSTDGTRAYIVDSDHVAVLCTKTQEVVDVITVGAQPSCLAVSPNGDRLYVADYAGGVTALSVDSQFIATDVLAVPDLRELEPATA